MPETTIQKAKDCNICQTDRHLQWKMRGPGVHWVHCDGCGQSGPPGATRAEAGKNWNRMS